MSADIHTLPGAGDESPTLGHMEIVQAICEVAAPTFAVLLNQPLDDDEVRPDVIECLRLQKHDPGFIAQEGKFGPVLRAAGRKHRHAFAALVVAIYR